VSAPHFFAGSVDGDRISIHGEDARHARRVLRIAPGERITVADGRGSVVTAVVEPDDTALVARVVDRRSVEPPRPRIVVYPALPKAGKLDLVVQKLTELGVAEVRPWIAERSIPRWDARKAAAQTERLRAIAHEAAKQSRRAFLLDVAEPAPLGDLPATTYVLHEGASGRLAGARPVSPPDVVGVVVGPEGGLSEREVEDLTAAGARPVTVAPTVLRAETAAIVGPALVMALFDQLG
jgi:16S rRNA (uracil1498-N3)-methyltransferase